MAATHCPGPCGLEDPNLDVVELAVEVDEARTENQRPAHDAYRLRARLQDKSPAGYANFVKEQSSSSQGGWADKALQEELLQQKRILLELQRENQELKEMSPSMQSAAGGRGGPKQSGGVSLADYQSLQRQVEELQRLFDQGAQQVAQLKQQQMQQQGRPGPLGYASPLANSVSSVSPFLGRGGGSRGGSGYATPSTTAGSYQQEEELRRKVQTMQAENEQLKRKVRMLAAT